MRQFVYDAMIARFPGSKVVEVQPVEHGSFLDVPPADDEGKTWELPAAKGLWVLESVSLALTVARGAREPVGLLVVELHQEGRVLGLGCAAFWPRVHADEARVLRCVLEAPVVVELGAVVRVHVYSVGDHGAAVYAQLDGKSLRVPPKLPPPQA